MKKHELTVNIGGKQITFETGRIARQANGAVMLRTSDTMIMATACQSSKPADDIDFLPMRVDYQEKFSSAGKTQGGFIKRDGKPSEREILTCRLIDRPIRPLFEDGYFQEMQLLNYVMSYDGSMVLEPLAICASSAALVISDIPLKKAVGAVSVGMIDGEFVLNPSVAEMENSEIELIIAGTLDAILMIEGFCDFLTEDQVLEACEFGHVAIKEICARLEEWKDQIGKEKNRDILCPVSKDLISEIHTTICDEVTTALAIAAKGEREQALQRSMIK